MSQLDGYLAQSQTEGRARMGILTDGRRWLLRWPGAGPPSSKPPYAFTFEDPDRWIALYEWLRDRALFVEEGITPTRGEVAKRFGPLKAILPIKRGDAEIATENRGVAGVGMGGLRRRMRRRWRTISGLKDVQEANYLLAIINSRILYESVELKTTLSTNIPCTRLQAEEVPGGLELGFA